MRDVEDIDQELRLLAAVRNRTREFDGGTPSIELVDQLLDERLTTADPAVEGSSTGPLPPPTDC